MEEVRQALYAKMHRYNHRQVHATTEEIPAIRFRRAQQEGNSLYPFLDNFFLVEPLK